MASTAQSAAYILCLASVVFVRGASAERSKYGITDQCTCAFDRRLPGGEGCKMIKDNECYPNHKQLSITEDCLPNIPDK